MPRLGRNDIPGNELFDDRLLFDKANNRIIISALFYYLLAVGKSVRELQPATSSQGEARSNWCTWRARDTATLTVVRASERARIQRGGSERRFYPGTRGTRFLDAPSLPSDFDSSASARRQRHYTSIHLRVIVESAGEPRQRFSIGRATLGETRVRKMQAHPRTCCFMNSRHIIISY